MGTTISAASAGVSQGYSARITATATAPPRSWAAMNAGAEEGAMLRLAVRVRLARRRSPGWLVGGGQFG
jgi:hypothetical protein